MQMTFSTSEHIPLPSEESACYRDITNIRVVMLDLYPEAIISNSSFQYYAVREWIVRGSCMCNGHADMCVPRPGEEVAEGKVYTGCMCRHNTAPTNCQECLSGFNNAPYQPGTPGEPNVCEGMFTVNSPLIWTRPPLYSGHFKMSQSMLPSANSPLK